MKKKLLLHIPHASLVIPSQYRNLFLLTEEELSKELLLMTDRYTDELFSVPGAETVMNPISRLVVDPERFLEGEEMEKVGMGIVYAKTHDGRILKVVDEVHRRKMVETYYLPHHEELFRRTKTLLEEQGSVLLVDCHSFSPKPLPYEPDQDASRPDICLGTDPFHTPESLKRFCCSYFRSLGYSVSFDAPYQGTLVPLPYLGKEKRVESIMIELNRLLYMNTETGEKNDHFHTLQKELAALFDLLGSWAM